MQGPGSAQHHDYTYVVVLVMSFHTIPRSSTATAPTFADLHHPHITGTDRAGTGSW